MFSDLQEQTRFSGGGVVAEFSRTPMPGSIGGGGGSSRMFPLSPVAKSNVTPHSVIFVGRETHILLRYDQTSHFLRENNLAIKFPQFREVL